MERIMPDIQQVLAVPDESLGNGADDTGERQEDGELTVHEGDPDEDSAVPGELWDPACAVAGGTAYGLPPAQPTGPADKSAGSASPSEQEVA
jgi:hypothetical protein